jgi:mono/diheme cytochrome c family protein
MKLFQSIKFYLTSIPLLMLVIACSDLEPDITEISKIELIQKSARWYSRDQVAQGGLVFAANCAICHGSNAEGIAEDWKQRLDDGSFPPPPLNGSAHAWHHPNSMLIQVIDNGGAAFGGKMPAFKDVLEEAEKLAAIAYFQNYWTDEIYGQWEQMGGTN